MNEKDKGLCSKQKDKNQKEGIVWVKIRLRPPQQPPPAMANISTMAGAGIKPLTALTPNRYRLKITQIHIVVLGLI